MRRRPRLFAALGAAAVVALCAGVVGVSAAVARPHGERVAIVDQTVPTDLQWVWVEACKLSTGYSGDPSLMTFASTDGQGVLTIELGSVDDEGTMDVDEQATAIVGACVASRNVEPDDGIYRPATKAERLTLHDWALRQQQPCLAARGIETEVAPIADFLAEDRIPWYLLEQYIWSGPNGIVDVDFDVLLEARLACPPMPAYLAEQGVGW